MLPSSSRSHITSLVDIISQQYFLSTMNGRGASSTKKRKKKQTFLVVRVVFSINGHEQFITDNIPTDRSMPIYFCALAWEVELATNEKIDEASLRSSFVSSKSLMEKWLSTIPTLARQSLEIASFLWNWDQFVYGRRFRMGEILKLPLWGETSSTVNKSRYLSHVSSPIKFCPFYHDKSSLPVSLLSKPVSILIRRRFPKWALSSEEN